MRLGRLTLDRTATGFQLVDHDGGLTLELAREDARFLFCWLMHRLNVKEATLTDGRRVEGFYQFEDVKKAIESMSEKSDSGIQDPVKYIEKHLEPEGKPDEPVAELPKPTSGPSQKHRDKAHKS